MHTLPYKIWKWGDSTLGGSNIQFDVGIGSKAKRSNDNPYEIANELLCARLGWAINLPIPSGVVLQWEGDDYFASLHVSVSGEELPPAIDEDLDAIVSNARLACGIIVFDSWILNEDRWRNNISYDDTTEKTTIIDHGRAFYFGENPIRDFEDRADKLGIGTQHCLKIRFPRRISG